MAKVGYSAVWKGQKSWNGVAILSRGQNPVLTRTSLPGDPSDNQSRYIEAAVGGVLIASIYAPNGNPQPGPKFDYKLAWLDRLRKHATVLRKSGAPIVRAGDFNVAPTDLDIYPTISWKDDALIQPESRARSGGFSAGVGLMLSGICIQASASTPSGITCATDGSVMQGFVSITCC